MMTTVVAGLALVAGALGGAWLSRTEPRLERVGAAAIGVAVTVACLLRVRELRQRAEILDGIGAVSPFGWSTYLPLVLAAAVGAGLVWLVVRQRPGVPTAGSAVAPRTPDEASADEPATPAPKAVPVTAPAVPEQPSAPAFVPAQRSPGSLRARGAGPLEEATTALRSARRVLVVPGYGVAAGQAQHALLALDTILRSRDVTVEYAVHPVAGRVPGHLDATLAEVPSERLLGVAEANRVVARADVVLVVGANDVVNPDAVQAPVEISGAKRLLVLDRAGGVGHAGVPNRLLDRLSAVRVTGEPRVTLAVLAGQIGAPAPARPGATVRTQG